MPKLKFFYPELNHAYLVPDKEKPKYIHQYGGTACNTVEIAEPIDLGIVECKYTSPSWWHLRATDRDNHNEWFAEREKKYIDIITKEEKTCKSFKAITAVYDKYYKWMMKKKRRRVYAGEIIEKIEQSIRANLPRNNISLLILSFEYKIIIHGKNITFPVTEAHIPVFFYEQTGLAEMQYGHIIWQNSD